MPKLGAYIWHSNKKELRNGLRNPGINITLTRLEMKLIVAFVLVSSIAFCYGRTFLELCPTNADTFGAWENVSTVNLQNARRHFVDSFYGEAVQFSRLWLPHNCSYHRFTQPSLQAVASHLIANGQSKSKTGKLHLMFMCDSITRGIMCGVIRILSGSEMFGPIGNALCGYSARHMPPSFDAENRQFDVDIGNFTISFTYIKTMETPATVELMEQNVFKKPYAIILNTGAWSFWGLPIKASPDGKWHPGDDCETPPYVYARNSRLHMVSQDAYARAGKLGQQLGVKMIYRTNHYNVRYGAHCADDELIPILKERKWEVWDNMRMSKDVWQQQTIDGFHFDRTKTHSVDEHKWLTQHALANNLEIPGMLEIQLAQSLLHYLFRDTIQEFITKGTVIPTK